MRMEGKIVLVTGAARGIGRACAERFLAEGACLALIDIDGDNLRKTSREMGEKTASFVCDVGIKAQVDPTVDKVIEKFGRIDVLINNAGTTARHDFLDLPEDAFDGVIRTNLKSVYLFSQKVGRHMVARGGGGSIVNMSSLSVLMTMPTIAPYAASKGAITAMTRAMALSLAPHGIRVNAIGPGTIVTELNEKALLTDEANRRLILSRTPIGRFGTGAEVAGVAIFLASDDSSYVTGETIYVDGGRAGLNYTVPVKAGA